jgi:hypothetical protein
MRLLDQTYSELTSGGPKGKESLAARYTQNASVPDFEVKEDEYYSEVSDLNL